MALNLRTLGVAIAVVGLAVGVSFGVGVAYGRGDPKTVQGGLTQQQIQSLLGISGAQAAGTGGGDTTGGTGSTNRAGGTQGGTGAGSAAAALARNATGQVVSVDGSTITIETGQGQTKVNVTTATTFARSAPATLGDIKQGTLIVAGGTRNADGSFDATSVSQVPSELSALATGLGTAGGSGSAGGAGGARGTPGSATPAPSPTPAR